MSSFKEPSLAQRQHAAAQAKKAALERFRARSVPTVEQERERTAPAARRAAAKPAAGKAAGDRAAQGTRKKAEQTERKAAKKTRDTARKPRQK